MIRKSTLLSIILILNIQSLYAQSISDSNNLITSIDQIGTTPAAISFTNTFEINNTGGHLQGIQHLTYDRSEYFILSGSSSEYSYYSIVKTGSKNMVTSHNKILDKPFKHAGGFQIYEHIMAIGVEDNDAKNKSKVFIFHLDNPEKPPKEPLAIIDRMGTFKRATAGCVGITIIKNKVLVVVGDWDSEHLDFYMVDKEKLLNEGATLELEYSINAKEFDKTKWTDPHWLSYQNINFVMDKAGILYIVGMTSNQKDENVVDLFQVESANLSTFKLQKIYSKLFEANNQTKFRWGAGISISKNQNLEIFSCGENINEESTIHIYK